MENIEEVFNEILACDVQEPLSRGNFVQLKGGER